jgi:hypothetical protein
MPVYQYEGQHFDLPDGLSNEQAIAKIEAHLGKTKATPSFDTEALYGDLKQRANKWTEGLQGMAETGASLVSGGLAMPAAPIVSGLSQLGNNPIGVEQAMERMTYAPRTEAGQEMTGNVGEALSRYVVPAAVAVQGLPYANTLAPLAEGLAGRLTRAAKATPKEAIKAAPEPVKGLSTALDELTGKAPEAPKAVEDTAFWKQRALQMEKDAQAAQAAEGQRPITVGPNGVEMPGMRSAQEALASFDRQVRREERQAPTASEQVLHVDEQGQAYRPGRPEDLAAEDMARKLQKQQAADQARAEAESAQAQRAGQGVQEEMFGAPELFDLEHAGEMPAREIPPAPTEQMGLFEPHTNMHRPYQEMFANEGGQTRPFSFNEFKEILNNLKDEPGTRFQMPEDIRAAYKDYLAHPEHGQQDLFGAHTVEAKPSHVPYGELSPQKRGAMTRKAKNGVTVSEAMLARMSGDNGIIKMNAMMPDDFLRKFPVFNSSTLKDSSGQLRVMYHGTSKDKHFNDIKAGPRGAWLAGDPVGASEYAKQNDSQKLVYEDGKYKEVNTASRVMPVYVNLKKPYTLTAADEASYRVAKSYAKFQKDLTERAKREGYDGIDWGHDIYTVFDASQMKSAIAPEVKTPNVVEMRSGFTAEDMNLSQLLHKFGGPSPLNNVPGIGERLKDIGNARIETPELAIKLATETPDVSQNVVQRGINALTKGGTYLKAKLNNPVVHFTVDRFLKAEGLAKAEVSEKLHGDYLSALRELSTKEYNDAFQLLNAADLAQKELTPEFMSKHGFSDNLQNFVLVHQNMMADTLGKINAAREAAGKKPITGRIAYSAMNMSGDFRKVAYKTIDGEKQVVGVLGANSKTIGKHSLSNLEKAMLEKDPSIEFGPLQDMSAINRSTKGTPHEAFMDVLDTLGEDNPHIQEFLKTLREVAKDDPNNYMGMQKHTMQKKGVWGMEGRKPWLSAEENAKAFFENQVKYMEGAYNWSGLAEAARDVNEVIRNEDVLAKQKNAVGLSEQYMQNALGINPSKIGNAATNLFNNIFSAAGIGPSVPRNALSTAKMGVNTAMLSLNPSFLAVQLLQSPSALPGITALLRGRGVAPGATLLTQGFDHSAKAMTALGKMVTGMGELTAVERGALDYAKKNHIYATDLVEHTNQTQKGAAYYASKLTQTPAAKIEAGTRAHMFMTLVSMMDEAGLKPKDGLFEQAQRFTDMAMNHYGELEKPPIYNALGPLGSMAYNLKSFGHNEISRWALYAREISKTGNPVPLLTQMATTIAMAGVMGLPFFSQWETIYDFITKKLGKPRSLALDVMTASQEIGKALGPKGAYALSNGLPTLMGVDLSKRVGLGDVLPSSASDAAFAGGSKLGDIVSSVAGAVAHPTQEEYLKKAAITVAPPVAQGPLDVSWYQKGNLAYSKNPEKLRPVAERNDTDVLLKKLGFTGINESSQKQKVYQQGQLDKAYQEYRTTAMNTIANDLFNNRPIAQTTIDKYFKTGQGDPATFEADLNRMALEQNMSPQQAIMLKQAASQRIPQLRSLQRRMQ